MKSYEEAQGWLKTLRAEKNAGLEAPQRLLEDESQDNEQIERFKRSSFDIVLGAMAAIRFIYGKEPLESE